MLPLFSLDCSVLSLKDTKKSRSQAGICGNVKVENGRRGKTARRASRMRMWGEDDRFLELASPTLSHRCKRRRSCHSKEALARVQDLSTPESSIPRLRSKSLRVGRNERQLGA